MSDKERLEKIKDSDIDYFLYGTRLKEYWDWLIEQAERMEILERELKDWKEVFYLLKSDHEKLENFQTGEWEIKYKALEQSE